MIVDELEISKDTVQNIVIENLKKGEFARALYHLH
jgi:predicted transcriptional regulator